MQNCSWWNYKILSVGEEKPDIRIEEGDHATVSIERPANLFNQGSKEKAVPNEKLLLSPFFNVSTQSIYNYNPTNEKLLVVFAVTVDSKNVLHFILLNA